jgi:hypothetical protein
MHRLRRSTSDCMVARKFSATALRNAVEFEFKRRPHRDAEELGAIDASHCVGHLASSTATA